MKAFLLCAGKSTRISSLTQGGPKPLLQVGGKSLLQRNIEWVAQFGIQDIWINLHHQPDAIKAFVGDGSQFGVSIQTVFESEILGTAGAVRNLCTEWENTFLVVYADNLYHFSLEALYRTHQKFHAPVTMALFHCEKSAHTGMAGGQIVVKNGFIEKFIEGSTEKISPYVNAGVYFLEPSIIDHIPDQTFYDFGKDLFPYCLANQIPLAAHEIDGYCLGVDTPEAYTKAQQILSIG